ARRARAGAAGHVAVLPVDVADARAIGAGAAEVVADAAVVGGAVVAAGLADAAAADAGADGVGQHRRAVAVHTADGGAVRDALGGADCRVADALSARTTAGAARRRADLTRDRDAVAVGAAAGDRDAAERCTAQLAARRADAGAGDARRAGQHRAVAVGAAGRVQDAAVGGGADLQTRRTATSAAGRR